MVQDHSHDHNTHSLEADTPIGVASTAHYLQAQLQEDASVDVGHEDHPEDENDWKDQSDDECKATSSELTSDDTQNEALEAAQEFDSTPTINSPRNGQDHYLYRLDPPKFGWTRAERMVFEPRQLTEIMVEDDVELDPILDIKSRRGLG